MDNLGDLIYIVILGVIAISGLFRTDKKKKRQKETSYPKPAIPQQPDLKDIFKKPEERNPSTRPAYNKMNNPQRRNAPFLQTGENELVPQSQTTTTKTLQINENEDPLEEGFHFRNPDELKKAFIYSEILNRKY